MVSATDTGILRGVRVIAIEEHWTLPELEDALDALPPDARDPSTVLNDHGGARERLEDLDSGRIAAMDELGVDLQVLALAPPATQALPAEQAVPLARRANDVALDAVRRHPERFRAMATLPLADPDAAIAELERVTSLGMIGAMVHGRVGADPLDDPRFDGVLEAAARLGAPLFLHPQIPPPAVRTAAYGGFDQLVELALSTIAWGWHVESATAMLRLLARGTFDRHPDLQIVMGHWGELLLFWGDRIASLPRVAGLERDLSDVLRSNLHITASGMLNPTLLRHALEVTTVDRMLFSTDYPFQRPEREQLDALLEIFATDHDREAFLGGNARRLYRIGTGTA